MAKHLRHLINRKLVVLSSGLAVVALIAWQIIAAVQISDWMYTYNPFAVFLSLCLSFFILFWWWGPDVIHQKIVDVLYYSIGAFGVALLAQSFQDGVQRTAVEIASRAADRDADVLDMKCNYALFVISFMEVDRAAGEPVAGAADMRSLCDSIADATSDYRAGRSFSTFSAVDRETRSDILRSKYRDAGTYDQSIRSHMEDLVEAFDTFEASLGELKLATEMDPLYFLYEPQTSNSREDRFARALEFYAPLMVLFALALKLAKSIHEIRRKG